MSPCILRVAIFTPLRKLFDYLFILKEGDPIPAIGARVLIPFGKQERVGIIVAITDHSDHPIHKLKHIHALLDTTALFPKTLLELIQWASRYYHCSLGEVFEAALPKKLRKGDGPYPTIPSEHPPHTSSKGGPVLELNVAQQEAVEAVTHSLGKFQTFLLDGVTGSGKTEVYIRVIEAALNSGKQALVLVPEIGLTPQVLSRFQERFNVPIAVLHSSLTEKQRFIAFENARTGVAPIVVGTRSAVFTPLQSPGVFIMDEEHDASFKQQEGFRYHARDLMIMRGSLELCPVLLGTATPSLETVYNTQQKRFQNLRLPLRAGNAQSPTVQVLDIRHKKLEEGLSAPLIKKIQEHIANQGQVLLFLNRRGFAPVMMCFDCGWTATCNHCDARMTFHNRAKKLQCHHCETTIPLYALCPSCNSTNLNPLGIGTERLEAILQKHFPTNSIVRIDRDTTRKKGSMQETLKKIENNEVQILLGTQMIAKGHHFPNVTLVAIIDIDHALFSTDFRSIERMGQLIIQVAGRAGRAHRIGEVVLQTCHPEHPLLKKLLEHSYEGFRMALLSERKLINLPPFSYQVLIRAEASKQERPLNFLTFIKNQILLKPSPSLKILGPIPAQMERRAGKYRAQLLLQGPSRPFLQALLNTLITEIESHPITQTVRWSLDVDPIELG